jgi:hypothetical protein
MYVWTLGITPVMECIALRHRIYKKQNPNTAHRIIKIQDPNIASKDQPIEYLRAVFDALSLSLTHQN